MEPHQFRLLQLVNTKLNYALEILDIMAEAMAAAGDPQQVKAMTQKMEKSTAALKTAIKQSEQVSQS